MQRYVFFSTLGASTRSRARLMRAKAVAERAVVNASLTHTVLAPSIVYSPHDPYLRLREHQDIVEIALRSWHRPRPTVGIPTPVVRRVLKLVELLMGPTAFATWDEAELLEVSMTSRHGTADAERLGVLPKPMRAVLGAG